MSPRILENAHRVLAFRNSALRASALVLTAAAILAGCATPPPAADSAAAAAPARPAPTAPVAAPVVAPVPELSPAQAKAQAQRLALDAVDQLQNGDEAAARLTLDKATALDPTNDLAKKLHDQIKADAQKELGPVFFRYTVQRDDSLSKLAQQYLGDRFRFYILAKYNDMASPNILAAGQVIKIPGRAPATPPPPVMAPSAAPVAETAAPAAAPEPKPRDDVADLLQKGKDLEAAKNLEGAYAAYSEAARKTPVNAEAVRRRDASRMALLRSLDREGTQAFQRQNLDLAISKWDRILEIDPSNQKARLERERSLELKKKMADKFGGTAPSAAPK
ncbi:MAG: LysM peptidoglycan-binding domain-containing protein [Betaproteobacteria bacterium]